MSSGSQAFNIRRDAGCKTKFIVGTISQLSVRADLHNIVPRIAFADPHFVNAMTQSKPLTKVQSFSKSA